MSRDLRHWLIAWGNGVIFGLLVGGFVVRWYSRDCLPHAVAYRMCEDAMQRLQSRCDDQLAALRSTAPRCGEQEHP